MRIITAIASILIIIGALNWGLYGISKIDIVPRNILEENINKINNIYDNSPDFSQEFLNDKCSNIAILNLSLSSSEL